VVCRHFRLVPETEQPSAPLSRRPTRRPTGSRFDLSTTRAFAGPRCFLHGTDDQECFRRRPYTTAKNAFAPGFDFQFSRQRCSILPAEMPDVRDPGFAGKAADESCSCWNGPGALSACSTSYSQMMIFFRTCAHAGVVSSAMRQATAPLSVLLETFKNNTKRASSFTRHARAGVDVPGEATFLRDRGSLAVPVPATRLWPRGFAPLQDKASNAIL